MNVNEALHETPRGSARIAFLAPGVFLGTITGHYSKELLAPYLAGMAAALKQSRLVTFNDWWDMTSYDSVCRTTMTEWVIANRARSERHHILVRSKLVAMGVATASMLAGGDLLASYTTRDTFDVALKTALREPCER
jgi:hypothetical protein